MTMPKPRAASPDTVAGLRAGVERLLEGGRTYAEISIDDLVAEGGLAKSTFYVYFRDKTELLRTLAAEVMKALIDFEGAWWTLPPEAGKDEIHTGVLRMYQAYHDHGALMAAIVDTTVHDRELREQFASTMDGAVEAAAHHLRACQAVGIAPHGMDPEPTAYWLIWTLERGFYRMYADLKPAARKRRLAAATDIIWHASRRADA